MAPVRCLNMAKSCVRAAVLVVLAAAFGGCGSPTGPGGGPPLLAILGNSTFTEVGQTSQLTAIETPSNAAPSDATSRAQWTSGNTGVVTVTASGLLTVVGYGNSVVKASHDGATAEVAVTVSIAGTWTSAATDINQLHMTWTLSQTGTSVTGTVGFLPSLPPGYVLTFSSISGSLSGTTLTFRTVIGVDGSSVRPDCNFEIQALMGTADILSSTSMNVRFASTPAPCDSNLPGTQIARSATPVAFAR